MGRFEDLIEQAEQGDASALATLKEEFSGSTLREKAEKADTFQSKFEANLPLIRKAKLADLMAELDDDLKSASLTADDFKDVDPDDLTLDMVKDRAKSQVDAAQESRLALAKESGFDTVEEFEAALTAAKQQKGQQRSDMEEIAGGAASSGGEPPGTQTEDTFEIAKKAHEEAKKAGQDDGRALGASIGALIEAQTGEEGEE